MKVREKNVSAYCYLKRKQMSARWGVRAPPRPRTVTDIHVRR